MHYDSSAYTLFLRFKSDFIFKLRNSHVGSLCYVSYRQDTHLDTLSLSIFSDYLYHSADLKQ